MQADSPSVNSANPTPHRSSRLLLVVAWLIVGIPAAWGVTQTAKRSMDLFKSPPPSPSATTAPTTIAVEETTAPTTTATTFPAQ